MSRKGKGLKQQRKWSVDDVQSQRFSGWAQAVTIICPALFSWPFKTLASVMTFHNTHVNNYQSHGPIRERGQGGKWHWMQSGPFCSMTSFPSVPESHAFCFFSIFPILHVCSSLTCSFFLHITWFYMKTKSHNLFNTLNLPGTLYVL